MPGDEEVIRRLDRIQATLALAFAPQLQAAREAIRDDDANAAILDAAASDWIGSTELQSIVAKKVSMSTRSVRDRLPTLVAQGVLEARGSEKRPEYRATGLV
jgi:hypothetical protein